jgi:hypothetical protein
MTGRLCHQASFKANTSALELDDVTTAKKGKGAAKPKAKAKAKAKGKAKGKAKSRKGAPRKASRRP